MLCRRSRSSRASTAWAAGTIRSDPPGVGGYGRRSGAVTATGGRGWPTASGWTVVATRLAVAWDGRADQGRLALMRPCAAQVEGGRDVGLVHEENRGAGRGGDGTQQRVLPREDRPKIGVRLCISPT